MSHRLDQLLKLHAADPNDPFCTYGIALEHAKAESFEQALAWLDKTLKLDPHYCYAYYQKGKINSDMGNDEQARVVLREGISVASKLSHPDAQHAVTEMTTLLESLG